MEAKELTFKELPPHYIDNNKKVVVAYISLKDVSKYHKAFVNMYRDYVIYVVWTKQLMNTLIFLLDHNLDPYNAFNTLMDMTIAYIQDTRNAVNKHFPIEINGNIYCEVILEKECSTVCLPFDYKLYETYVQKYSNYFNNRMLVLFGPESNKNNAERHNFLSKEKLWPKYRKE